jgi:hypothetical protein
MDNLRVVRFVSTSHACSHEGKRADLEEVIEERVQIAIAAKVQAHVLHHMLHRFTPASRD